MKPNFPSSAERRTGARGYRPESSRWNTTVDVLFGVGSALSASLCRIGSLSRMAVGLVAVLLVAPGLPLPSHAVAIIGFPQSSGTVMEGMGQLAIAVRRTNDLSKAVTVRIRTVDGTALAGSDYSERDAILEFPAGETNAMLRVPILNDGVTEGHESFVVLLSEPGGGAALGLRSELTVGITDNDRGLQFYHRLSTANEDAGEVVLAVVRHDDAEEARTVAVATVPGTATSGEDYDERAGTLAFAAGERLQRFAIPLRNDAAPESNETIRVTLEDSSGGGNPGPQSSATVTVVDTDESVEFGASAYSCREDAEWVEVWIRRGESDGVGRARLATRSGAAREGLDYQGLNEIVEFAAGERSKRIRVPIVNDENRESEESFYLDLSDPLGAARWSARPSTKVILTDDDPGLGFERSTNGVRESAGWVEVNVVRGHADLRSEIAVDYESVDGSARAGTDYRAVSGTLRLGAGETVGVIRIPLIHDPAREPPESFRVMLLNPPAGIPLGLRTNQVTILDDANGVWHELKVPVEPGTRLQRENGLNLLTWVSEGRPQRADRVDGPWSDLTGAESPYASRPVAAAGFYRIQPPRPTQVFVPSCYDGSRPFPLVVALHGYGGDAAGIASEFRIEALAEARGFLLCQPEGLPESTSAGARFWNAADTCCAFYDPEVDDSAYLRRLLEECLRRYRVDRKQIYVMGRSNGGFMSHRMASDHSDLIAGIAATVGVISLAAPPQPAHPVHVLQIHATADDVVPYLGGTLGWGIPVRGYVPSALTTVQIWADRLGCRNPIVEATPSFDLDLSVDGPETTVLRYTDGPPGAAVELWTLHGSNHFPNWRPGTASYEFTEKVIDWLLAHPKP